MPKALRWIGALLLGPLACVEIGPGSPLCPNVPLNQTRGTITITQESGAPQATATAALRRGSCVQTLENGQELAINGQVLSGPDADGNYAATIPTDGGGTPLTIFVNEPTRGVSETVIHLPLVFEVTSPPAGGAMSLAGTTFTWSAPEPDVDVRILIRQNLFGELREREYGPFDDTGSVRLNVSDLQTFAQGADVTIMVTKTRELNAINGLQSGTVTAELTRTFTAVPAP